VNSGQQFSKKKQLESDDLLAETPLERAYLWTLATLSAANKILFFDGTFFKIKCEDIKTGRIFKGTTKETLDLGAIQMLKNNTIYYADEKHDGVKSHPYEDIFFLTKQIKLVLIDVTGATRKKTVNKKAKRLGEWVAYGTEQSVKENGGLTFHGVLLAPLLDGEGSIQGLEGVSILNGSVARDLLGGLSQLLAWFAQDV